MSSRQLSQFKTDLTVKGLNFLIVSKRLPNEDIEDIKIPKPLKESLYKNKRKALKGLQSDTSTLILTVDKCRSTAVLNHEDYFEKCIDHANNNQYQLILPPKSKLRH